MASPVSVPVPLFVTFTVWAAGLAAPDAPAKVAVVAESWIVGAGGGVTVKVTVIVCGELVTPAAAEATLTVAVYVPATSAPAVAVSVTTAGVVPPSSDAESHPVGCPD